MLEKALALTFHLILLRFINKSNTSFFSNIANTTIVPIMIIADEFPINPITFKPIFSLTSNKF